MRTHFAGLLAVALLVASPVLAGQVMYDFEDGNQGWGSYGPLTTDSGLCAGAVGQGRYHAADFDLAGWGIVSLSPSVNVDGFDLSAFDAMSVQARLAGIEGFEPFVGNPELRFGLGIGSAEWYATIPLTEDFQEITVNFADLVPYEAATAPITAAELADPGLQVKMVVYNADNSGVGVLYYDEITAVPEPATMALVGLSGLILVRRRR